MSSRMLVERKNAVGRKITALEVARNDRIDGRCSHAESCRSDGELSAIAAPHSGQRPFSGSPFSTYPQASHRMSCGAGTTGATRVMDYCMLAEAERSLVVRDRELHASPTT